MLSQEVMVPPKYKQMTKGLLGDFDGDSTNDFIFVNGSILASNSSERHIFPFAQSCKLLLILFYN